MAVRPHRADACKGRHGHRTRRDLISPETVILDQATDEAVAIWHAQQAQSWTTNIIGGFEKALTDAGLLKILPRSPAICFLGGHLPGAALGDRDAQEAITVQVDHGVGLATQHGTSPC